ncbi:MAG: Gldg family protein [Gemmatimonadota bacterium]
MIGRVLTIARRELRSYFDHATAYILLVVFLATNFFFFFRAVFVAGEGSLRAMFGLMPWLLLFFVPAVTMRALAEEKRSGTLELVLSQPIGELEFLIGKFLGVMGFLTVALGGTLGALVGLSVGADVQLGVAAAQYVGTLLLMSGLVGIGLWTSSLTRNQVTAFILGVALIFVFYALGLEVVLLGLPPTLARISGLLGILGHFVNIGRGVLDLRDVLYFVSLTAAFLALAYFSLLRDRLSRERPAYRRLVTGTAGLVGIAVLVSLLGGQIRGRLDLTPGKAYTLSRATRSILGGLNDLVSLKFVWSKELPPQFASVKRDVEDMLRDYVAAGRSNVRLDRLTPEGENEDRQEAQRLGIPPIQFNVLGEEEFQVKQGYLGLAIEYAGESKTIPVIQRTEDLEYRLTSAIRSLTRDGKPTAGFLMGHGERGPSTGLRNISNALRDEYGVTSIMLDSARTQIPDSVDVLVVAGPVEPLRERDEAALKAYLAHGGSVLLLLPGTRLDQRSRMALPIDHPVLDSLLAPYGVKVAGGLAFDLKAPSRVSLPSSGGLSYVVPYPVWPLLRPASNHAVAEDLGPVMAPWPSPIDITAADSGSVVPLLTTTEYGGRLMGPTNIDATRNWGSLGTDLSRQITAVALLPRPAESDGAESDGAESDGGKPVGTAGRIVLVGDADFISDDFLQNNVNNLRFFMNAIDWLAQDEALISIRSKNRTPPRLLFSSAFVRDGVKYGNLIGVPLLFVLAGILRLARRRSLYRKSR